jgi:hypothetical protein
MIDNGVHIDLMIGGAQKAGTTSLSSYMAQHPSILTHPQMECSFFVDDEQYKEGHRFFERKYFPFSEQKRGKRVIAKHATLYRNLEALQRLKRDHPSTHLVLLLRDPVERAYSSYLHQKKLDQETYSFSEVLDQILGSSIEEEKWKWRYNIYLGLGCYFAFLEGVNGIFPEEDRTILLTERLQQEPVKVCQELFLKLGLDPTFIPEVSKMQNPASVPRSKIFARVTKKLLQRESRTKSFFRTVLPSYFTGRASRAIKEWNQKPVNEKGMFERDRQRLIRFYEPWNERLKEATGLDLRAWKNLD